MKPISAKRLVLLVVVCCCYYCCSGYVPPAVRQRWKEQGFSETLDQSMQTIERCAEKGENTVDPQELFWATKFVDRNGIKLFADLKDKQALLDTAKGSWELRLACKSGKDLEFHPHPEFRSFAMAFITVDDDYFGKGIATDPNFCFVSLGGPSSRNENTRQVYMEYDDFYINGQEVPACDLSVFLRGYARNWAAADRKRPRLAFTVVCANEKVMVVRGSKTGGLAIFRRIPEDMRPCAYGY